ncbi:hypothetical protein DsansV1_C04g0038171 [Dioscorea sansibarensis]
MVFVGLCLLSRMEDLLDWGVRILVEIIERRAATMRAMDAQILKEEACSWVLWFSYLFLSCIHLVRSLKENPCR